jgi:hypothetical protein
MHANACGYSTPTQLVSPTMQSPAAMLHHDHQTMSMHTCCTAHRCRLGAVLQATLLLSRGRGAVLRRVASVAGGCIHVRPGQAACQM